MKNTHSTILALRGIISVALLCFPTPLANATDKPNVIFFLVDDLGWRDVEHRAVHPPALHPLCAPIRRAGGAVSPARRDAFGRWLADDLRRGASVRIGWLGWLALGVFAVLAMGTGFVVTL